MSEIPTCVIVSNRKEGRTTNNTPLAHSWLRFDLVRCCGWMQPDAKLFPTVGRLAASIMHLSSSLVDLRIAQQNIHFGVIWMCILIYYTASSAVSSHAHDTQLIIIWSESSWDSRRIAASSRLHVWNVLVHRSAEAQQYWLQYVVSRHSPTTYQHIHRNYISKVIKTTFWSKCLHCVMMGCTNLY